MKISGVYKITNTVTGEFYIGSSKNIKQRWKRHKYLSTWNKHPNVLLYVAFQDYGIENFLFEIIEETTDLKSREQYYISILNPKYNVRYAIGENIEKDKAYKKQYRTTKKCKSYMNNYYKDYYSRFCIYNGKKLTLKALVSRFRRNGIEHPFIEAKKYLIEETSC